MQRSAADSGKFWKTPFVWEPGCPEPAATTVAFSAAPSEWLADALASVIATSIDEADQFAVAELGAVGAANELLALAPRHFDLRPGWWRMARNERRDPVGFVLPVLFRGEKTCKNGRPEGTLFHIGVLPAFRGQGYGAQLLAEATRIVIAADCWRSFSDTSTRNEPVIRAFRSAGYKEQPPWQRPIAYWTPRQRRLSPRAAG